LQGPERGTGCHWRRAEEKHGFGGSNGGYACNRPEAKKLIPVKNELKDFSTSKGTIRFPVDKPMPAALVKKLVKARIAQNEHKKQH